MIPLTFFEAEKNCQQRNLDRHIKEIDSKGKDWWWTHTYKKYRNFWGQKNSQILLDGLKKHYETNL